MDGRRLGLFLDLYPAKVSAFDEEIQEPIPQSAGSIGGAAVPLACLNPRYNTVISSPHERHTSCYEACNCRNNTATNRYGMVGRPPAGADVGRRSKRNCILLIQGERLDVIPGAEGPFPALTTDSTPAGCRPRYDFGRESSGRSAECALSNSLAETTTSPRWSRCLPPTRTAVYVTRFLLGQIPETSSRSEDGYRDRDYWLRFKEPDE